MSKPKKTLPNKSLPVKEVEGKNLKEIETEPVTVVLGIGFNSGVKPVAQEPNAVVSKNEQYLTKHEQSLPGQNQNFSEQEQKLHTSKGDPSEQKPELSKQAPRVAASTKPAPTKAAQIRKRILLWIRDMGIAVLVAILIMQFVRPTIVQQHSMEDTLHENDYVFLNRQAYNFGEIKQGDIFVFKYTPPIGSGEEEKNLIKRVVGLPGDQVSINDGSVYVNGQAIDDSYTKDGYTDGVMDPMLIPENYIFALGDNRQNSFDSRDPMLGLIDMRDVVGKAVFRAFPISDAGTIN